MGSLGVPEMMVIFILALVLFGPKKLPEIGKTIGKAITEFRRASSELKDTFNKEMQNLERETESIKEAANPYQYDNNTTYNYDYTSYEAPPEALPAPETEHAAIPSSESASAIQGAESTPGPEGTIPQGYDPVTHPVVEHAEASEQSEHAEGHETAVTPAENKA